MRKSKANDWFFGFLAFSVLVVGGVGYFLSQNVAVNYKSGASSVIQTAVGKLVKKGSREFSPCNSPNTAYKYGLLATLTSSGACTPLVVNVSLADPLVGKTVIATGTLQSGVFYATGLKLYSSSNCPQAGACPYGGDHNTPSGYLLRNCYPSESDGTPHDSLCNQAGRVEPCGPTHTNYCCPAPGKVWTTDMSKCKATPRPLPTPRTPTSGTGTPYPTPRPI